ncbi:mitochondrial adenyl nucleotide antiporter SLC25A23-like isoform X2 [Narcine bancroftii]|uniref:mitochondrial adenyl nucleotide antiporter SLC25A23-like isoform X2 n=1 Tax=Narcine bancroftii TaxID=1343680 RepID=UPI0038313124
MTRENTKSNIPEGVCLRSGETSEHQDLFSKTLLPETSFLQTFPGTWWKHLVAGAVAGAVSRTWTAPLDRLKIHVQVNDSKGVNLLGSLKAMVKEGGYTSLWRGNGVNVMKIAPETGIKFLAYDKYKRLFSDSHTKLDIHQRFAAGSLAGVTAQTIVYPLEVLKTRLALGNTGQYKGINNCMKILVRNEGLAALYKGFLPNLLGIIPYAGIELTVYECLKKGYCQWYTHDPKDPGIFIYLGCGTTSSTCGQLGSYPLALIRTKMQAQAICKDGTQVSMVQHIMTIMREDGLRGFYRGFTPNCIKVVPAVSISFVIYEWMRNLLGLTWN